MKRWVIFVLTLAVIVLISLKGREPKVIKLQGQAMGSSWTLAFEGGSDAAVRKEVAEVLERWEQVMSQWRADSDLSRFNRGEDASGDLLRVLDLAGEIKEQTDGAFDFELLGLVHESGFGPEGTGVDLSAIGKGFAVDRVGDRLRWLGIDRFVFELGGEVLAGEGEWKCAIESPLAGGEERVLTVTNRAVATSGNYKQFRASNDGLVSHIIDPRGGKPVVREPCAVTVFADDCATADAWATALFVLGPDAKPENAPEFVWSFGSP
jgi:thiamine biosynthesis lipoprotein